MATVFAAKSKTLQEWGSDVGQSKHLYAVGVGEGKPADIAAEWNAAAHAGQTDWTVIAHRQADVSNEQALLDKIAERVTRLDPNYFPRIKGDRSVYKLNMQRIEAHFVMLSAAASGDSKVKKLKAADIGNYLLDVALA